jgi:L-fuculose-phosphate aldolase
MGDRQTYIINQIVKYSQILHQKNFVANHDGNISAKFEDVLLATPTAVNKGNIVADMIITLDMQGKKIVGIGKPFSEIKLHLAAYNARPEAKAVVHAHPPFATAHGLVGKALIPNLPEAIVSIGEIIPVTPFAMPSAPENDTIVNEALNQADAFIMPGNGVLAIGDSVEQAYLRIELVEHVAKIQFYAAQMGTSLTLSAENLNKLLEKRASIGLGSQKSIKNNLDMIKKLIAKEIKEYL